jgi:hypothetical protein
MIAMHTQPIAIWAGDGQNNSSSGYTLSIFSNQVRRASLAKCAQLMVTMAGPRSIRIKVIVTGFATNDDSSE